MTRDASVTKRDCGLETRSMEEYAHSLLEMGWTETVMKVLLLNECKQIRMRCQKSE